MLPASSKARDRKNPVTSHQINLSKSPMRRGIARFATVCHGIKFTVGTPGLRCLRAADFSAIRRHRGVIRHVLRLKRTDFEPAVAISPAKPGDDERLSGA